MRLSLVIPIYNETGNIKPLVNDLAKLRTHTGSPEELILVDNGSTDQSAEEIAEVSAGRTWVRVISLDPNVGYGGGIQAGLRATDPQCTHVGWIPADRQYSCDDLHRVWAATQKEPQAMHKGWRRKRLDGAQTQFISVVYTQLTRFILGLPVKDINGLPKILPRSLFEAVDFPLAQSFHLDSQILMAAHRRGLPIIEHPVTFYARRAGVSSWSSKKFRVYRETLFALFQIRTQSKEWFRQA